MLFTLIYLLGTLASFAFFSYMKGHADARFRDNPGLTENPPFIIGMATAWLWPLQILIGGLWSLYHVCTGLGKGSGMAINEELSSLRTFAGEYNKEFTRTMKFLQNNNIDASAVDDNVKRALTARSIEWAMGDEAMIRREEKGLMVKGNPTGEKEVNAWDDSLFDILDSAGLPVSADYAERHKGELDI